MTVEQAGHPARNQPTPRPGCSTGDGRASSPVCVPPAARSCSRAAARLRFQHAGLRTAGSAIVQPCSSSASFPARRFAYRRQRDRAAGCRKSPAVRRSWSDPSPWQQWLRDAGNRRRSGDHGAILRRGSNGCGMQEIAGGPTAARSTARRLAPLLAAEGRAVWRQRQDRPRGGWRPCLPPRVERSGDSGKIDRAEVRTPWNGNAASLPGNPPSVGGSSYGLRGTAMRPACRAIHRVSVAALTDSVERQCGQLARLFKSRARVSRPNSRSQAGRAHARLFKSRARVSRPNSRSQAGRAHARLFKSRARVVLGRLGSVDGSRGPESGGD